MILTILEHDQGQLSKISTEALTFARQLATDAGCAFNAVAVGSIADAASVAQAYGVNTLYTINDDQLNDYAPEAYAASIAQLAQAENAHAIVGSGSDRGNEILAYLGAKLNEAVAANCLSVSTGDTYAVTRVRWGGSLLEEAELSGAIKLLTVAQHSLEAAEQAGDAPTITPFSANLDAKVFRVRITNRVVPEADGISLTDAPIVVSGGRGVGSEEAFVPLAELADLVGGAVGCSRAVTNNGWQPHANQVGQTGARVAPDLYIACGISGASQHMAGCAGSKILLAINTDPEAPILARANYAVLGDLHEVIPALSEALRSR